MQGEISSKKLKLHQIRDQKTRKKMKAKAIASSNLPKGPMTKEETWEFLRKKGLLDENKLYPNTYDWVKDVWKGEPCFIIGGGPTLKDFIHEYGWGFFDDKNTIGINHMIEDYDKIKWHFFLDKRFLDKTTYDMENFKGIVFAQNTSGYKGGNKVSFYCNNKEVGQDMRDGLFSANFSGLACLNLALISGASPIYLIGFGMGKDGRPESYHYKDNYTGEQKTEMRFKKFQNVYKYFEHFKKYNDRIIHVTDGKDIEALKNKVTTKNFYLHWKDVKRKIDETKIKITQEPKIVHVSFTDDINKHADVTRHIMSECIGSHILISQDRPLPDADLYVLEHFQSTDNYVKKFKHKNKAIDIVHTVNGYPDNTFRKIMVFTEAWKKHLMECRINPALINVIPIGINIEEYKDCFPDYTKKVFGRITRWSPGKIHPKWNDLALDLLTKHKDASMLIYTQLDQGGLRKPLQHERATYDKSCQINMFKGQFLKNMSIYVHANGSFIDTFSHGVLEAMASGLPVIALDDKIGAVKEVLGGAGIICDSIEKVKSQIDVLLSDESLRHNLGMISKSRSKLFTKEKMVNEFNRLIMEALK